MKIDKSDLLLYAVTDDSWLNGRKLESVVEDLIKGGVTCVQLREKNASDDELIDSALKLLPICRRYEIPLIIDDNVRVAKEVNANGVHIGQDDMALPIARVILGPQYIIGVSCHNVEEALKAQSDGADYIGVGAVFGSKTKKDVQPMTPDLLKRIANSVNIPVVGIGGINGENINELKDTNISGVAVVSALFAANDPKEAAEKLKKSCEKMFGEIV